MPGRVTDYPDTRTGHRSNGFGLCPGGPQRGSRGPALTWWLADLLLQLSDKQISDAFRAANYSNEDVNLLTTAVKNRIAALDSATREVVAETIN